MDQTPTNAATSEVFAVQDTNVSSNNEDTLSKKTTLQKKEVVIKRKRIRDDDLSSNHHPKKMSLFKQFCEIEGYSSIMDKSDKTID